MEWHFFLRNFTCLWC